MTSSSPLRLPPHDDPDAVVAWVHRHLGDLTGDGADDAAGADGGASADDATSPTGPDRLAGDASPRFRGGDGVARRALGELDVRGYAARRNEVWPPERRGATELSPYVRHGLITLPELWDAVAGAPERDRTKYRDELLWQEYARHLYARVGTASGDDLRHRPATPTRPVDPEGVTPFDGDMECVRRTVAELETDGWLVNQTRMWLASHWAIRHEVDWRSGEDHFFRHLLDGSRAANRLGWQWTTGRLTGSAYGFSRRQVERRAPGWCAACPLRHDCPIERWPDEPDLGAIEVSPVPLGRIGAEAGADDAGPLTPEVRAGPGAEAVWLTAESLSADDPARRAHRELPAMFVFDAPLLARLRLSTKRLVFLTECLADPALAGDELEVHLGDPLDVLAGRRLATTFTPVPGGRRRRAALDVRALHPWPWLRRPVGGSVGSFSAWRRGVEPRR